MKDKYFLMFETEEKIPGYPVFFNYDVVDCGASVLKEDCLVYCKSDIIRLRAKNPKLSFDFKLVASNYFVSNILWDVIDDYRSWDFIFKDAVFFGKNNKEVATKKYKVLCFKNKYKPEYIDRLESLYIIPNFKYRRKAELYKPSVVYEILNKYDVVPSHFSGYPDCLIVSEKVRNDKRLENTKLEFIPIEEAGKILFLREDRVKRAYNLKQDPIIDQLPIIKGKELLENGYKGKKIIF